MTKTRKETQITIFYSDRYTSIQEAIETPNGNEHLPDERINQDTNIVSDKYTFDWTDNRVGYRIWNVVKEAFNEEEREFNKIIALSTLDTPDDLVDYLNND